MKKNIIIRIEMGFPLGITISHFITIFISLCIGSGEYFSCVPELVTVMGNETSAVILQTILSGILGSGFSASSLIWEMDHWSIAKQTGLYFLIISILMLPIAYFTYWMEHTLLGFISYFAIFAAIFIVTWLVIYLNIRSKINGLNKTLAK